MQCQNSQESGVPELISAMAAGWSTTLVVETWSHGGAIAASIGLAVAVRHTGGRHVCLVPDEESAAEYAVRMAESGVEPPQTMTVGEDQGGLEGIDFLVVDSRTSDLSSRVIEMGRLGQRGAVVVCKNAAGSGHRRWHNKLDERIVRRVFLPVGEGLDVAHVSATGEGWRRRRRWIKRVDHQSGEEFLIRRR